ncbi:MAG: (2Fe-2S)-binding protein [Deltaproteobacteria bacterium]|nr:(2Fe-2S)-binding protein [Deltaproteobacteria bacterium]
MPGSDRTLICACEDITLTDVKAAIEKGYRDVESVKRYTGFGTGICQGRSCLTGIARLLREAGVPAQDLLPITPRPPVGLVPLGELAAMAAGDPDAEPGSGG